MNELKRSTDWGRRIAEIAKAEKEGRLIMLPVPIGAPVFVVYSFAEPDGSIDEGVEELRLSGYIKEGDREFYTTYDEAVGSCDFKPEDIFVTRIEAEKALSTACLEAEFLINNEQRNEPRCCVCGCTQDNACPGGCYWVKKDLCSQCMENPEEASA